MSVLFWGFMFYEFREYGFIDVHNYLNACIISLETITTVGYTVTDISFRRASPLFSSARRRTGCLCSAVLRNDAVRDDERLLHWCDLCSSQSCPRFVNPSDLLVDARSLHSLQQEGSDSRDQWRVVLHVPDLRETKAPAH